MRAHVCAHCADCAPPSGPPEHLRIEKWMARLPAADATSVWSVAVAPQRRALLRDRIFGLLFGAALGDAMGLAAEFMRRAQASFRYGTQLLHTRAFTRDRHRERWLAGDWTDDTDQMLLLLFNLLEGSTGAVRVPQFSESLLQWAHRGFPETGDAAGLGIFHFSHSHFLIADILYAGIGATVQAVLVHPKFITDAHACAFEVWDTRGRTLAANGAVMRTAVLGVPHFTDLNLVLQNSDAACKV